MKIVIINGSPRKNGATSCILHMMEGSLLEYEDVNIDFIDLVDLDIKMCTGCCSCYKNGKCYINDEAEMLSERISSADGLIIGSPTYASNVSGQLKVFIDRGHFVIEQLLHGKYAITVATGENYGSNDTSKVLNRLVQYSGALLTGKIVYNCPFNERINDARIDKNVNGLIHKFYMDIKNRRKHPMQSIIHSIIFNVGIKPFVKRKGDKYQGVVNKWNEKGIFL